MVATIALFIQLVRGVAEVAALIISAAELYKLYQSWLESKQTNPQHLEVIGLGAAA